MKIIWLWLFLILIETSTCIADYIAIGPFEGDVCTGFVVKFCSPVKLDAVKKGGRFYEIKKVWDKVDDYKEGPIEGEGRCWIRSGSGAFGFLNSAPDFYHYDKTGELQPVDVDGSITFKCQKR